MWFRNCIKRVSGPLRFAAIPAIYPSKPWINEDYDVFERLKLAVTPRYTINAFALSILNVPFHSEILTKNHLFHLK